MACKARGIFYKQMDVGRESAYGTLAHLRSDQGKHILIEIAWQAKRKSTAFLGRTTDWRHDPRLAIAQDLCAAGHRVEHISSDGSCETHAKLECLPDWLSTEEERLRKLEKKRQSGDMQRKQKSAVDRSSEAIASHSMRPAQELDAMAALREAESQPELKIVQQKLARIQRIADKKDLPNKVLINTPGFIKQEASLQADWIAQRKHEKQKKHSSTDATATGLVASEDVDNPQLQVECIRCGVVHSWSDLQRGDGICERCSTSQQENGPASHSPTSQVSGVRCPDAKEDSTDLEVECQSCRNLQPWSLLVLGDGLCSRCFERQQEHVCTATDDSQASSSTSMFSQAALPLNRESKVLHVMTLDDTQLRSESAVRNGPVGSNEAGSNEAAGSGWRVRRRAVS